MWAAASPILARARYSFAWLTSIPNPVPYKYRARRLRSKLRARQSPASSVAAVETSFSPAVTLRKLSSHRWSVYDAQYLVLLTLGIFALLISPAPGPLAKMAMVVTLIAALIVPVTSQFFFPFLPILTWLVFFFSCRFIPAEYRPPIWVRVLPALENIFYGANLSNILSAHKFVILDVLAWLPYGIIHFGAPFVCSAAMFLFAAPGTTPIFARSFGYLNIIGVCIQMLFPCSPPWYENQYGLAPANYSIKGEPAGLARIDMLFGIDLYTSNFRASPVVFGAFPSLHAGNAVIEALFMSYCFPKFRPLFIAYTMWLWWATMYLSHHYAVDLVGGSLIAAVIFYIAKSNWIPRRQEGKFRWDYDYVEMGDVPVGLGVAKDGFPELDGGRPSLGNEDWTVCSGSSFSSGSLSPIDHTDPFMWEGETLASNSDEDVNGMTIQRGSPIHAL